MTAECCTLAEKMAGCIGLLLPSCDRSCLLTQHGMAGRLSYLYGLNGPSVAIDTACSSSLVAVASARNALLLGISGGALAGGITLLLNPSTMAMYAVAGAPTAN